MNKNGNSNRGKSIKALNHLNPHNPENEYDLAHNFKKVNSYGARGRKKSGGGLTAAYDDNESSARPRVIDGSADMSPTTSSGGMSMENYFRLENRITDFTDKNNQAHNELRHELEDKIKQSSDSIIERLNCIDTRVESKLAIQTFYRIVTGLIGALTLIVGIWWTISYSDVYKCPQKIQDLDNRIQEIEEQLNFFEKDTIQETDIKKISTAP